MQSTRLKFPLVAFLALLQCLVPLIHGHLGGQSGAHAHEGPGGVYAHVHADEFNPERLSASGKPALTAASDEAPAIGVSQEFKRDHFVLPILGCIVAIFLVAAFRGRTAVFRRAVRPMFRMVFHSRPPATAPPARAA